MILRSKNCHMDLLGTGLGSLEDDMEGIKTNWEQRRPDKDQIL